MKLTNKIIDEVVAEATGEETVQVVKLIRGRKNVSEFKLADQLNQEVNYTRNLLYKLHERDLVSFIRRKDKKKGWYIYYWTFKPEQINGLMKSMRAKRLDGLKERLKREKGGNFFLCTDRCIRLDFEQAVSFDFKCPECGSLMNQEDNTQKIKDIEKEIIMIEGI
ncbi:MAG: hypothetical protein GY861_26775 [bacterium]|nr:hypothetical protein [bacterium]